MHQSGTNSSVFNNELEVKTAQCSPTELNGGWMELSWVCRARSHQPLCTLPSKPTSWLDKPHSVYTPVFELNREQLKDRACLSLYPLLHGNSVSAQSMLGSAWRTYPSSLPTFPSPLAKSLSLCEFQFSHLKREVWTFPSEKLSARV